MDKKLNDMLRDVLDSLTEEQKEKARACRTDEELIALAAKEGVELPDETLDAVAGGGCGDPKPEEPKGFVQETGAYLRRVMAHQENNDS